MGIPENPTEGPLAISVSSVALQLWSHLASLSVIYILVTQNSVVQHYNQTPFLNDLDIVINLLGEAPIFQYKDHLRQFTLDFS